MVDMLPPFPGDALPLFPGEVLPLGRSVPAALAASGNANAAAMATAMRDFDFSMMFLPFSVVMNLGGRLNDLPGEAGHYLPATTMPRLNTE
jgi:hypothetical protein